MNKVLMFTSSILQIKETKYLTKYWKEQGTETMAFLKRAKISSAKAGFYSWSHNGIFNRRLSHLPLPGMKPSIHSWQHWMLGLVLCFLEAKMSLYCNFFFCFTVSSYVPGFHITAATAISIIIPEMTLKTHH